MSKNGHGTDAKTIAAYDKEIDELIQENAMFKNKYYEQERERNLLIEELASFEKQKEDWGLEVENLHLEIADLKKAIRAETEEKNKAKENYNVIMHRNGDMSFNEVSELKIREQELLVRNKMLDTELASTKQQYKDFSNRMENLYGDTQHRIERENSD